MLSVTTLNIPEAMLRLLEQAFKHVRSWSTSHASSCTFLLASATLVASLGPHLGGRIVGPRELKAQLGELNTNCNSSSFLNGLRKWPMLIPILFVIMIKQMHNLMKQVKLFLSTQEEQERSYLGTSVRSVIWRNEY